MLPALQILLVALAATASLLALVAVVRNELPGWWLVSVLAALELGLVVQCVVGLAQLAGGDHDVTASTFVVYLVGILLVIPAALLWVLAERTRWGTAVLVAAGVVIIALIGRLQQIWSA